MAERGKHQYAWISAGSNTTVKDGAGSLYSINLSPGQGSVVLIVDSDGATNALGAAPNLNSDALTGTIGRLGPYSTSSNGTAPTPTLIAFAGLGFNSGLTLAATSNARMIVEYE